VANLDVDPERSILLGLQAVAATYPLDGFVTGEAEDALHRAILDSRALRTLKGHTAEGWSVAYSPDGTRLAIASQDTTARICEASSGRQLLTLSGNTGSVNGAIVRD
jgi:WD40 repeat protein